MSFKQEDICIATYSLADCQNGGKKSTVDPKIWTVGNIL